MIRSGTQNREAAESDLSQTVIQKFASSSSMIDIFDDVIDKQKQTDADAGKETTPQTVVLTLYRRLFSLHISYRQGGRTDGRRTNGSHSTKRTKPSD